MPLFPPAAPVTVTINGRPLAAYAHAYLVGGRVYAPVSPLLTRLADRVWFEGENLVIERGRARVRVRVGFSLPDQLDAAFVAVGPILRAIGASVRYESSNHHMIVHLAARAIVASPTPFNPAVPTVAPSAVFTPAEPVTPRPLWTGSPLPRRTALPVPPLGAGNEHDLPL